VGAIRRKSWIKTHKRREVTKLWTRLPVETDAWQSSEGAAIMAFIDCGLGESPEAFIVVIWYPSPHAKKSPASTATRHDSSW
jgi:hypothetical protein